MNARRIKKLAVALFAAAALAISAAPSNAASTYSPDGYSFGQYPLGSQIYVHRAFVGGTCHHTSSYVNYGGGQRLETSQACPASAQAGLSGLQTWRVCTNKKGTDSCSTYITNS